MAMAAPSFEPSRAETEVRRLIWVVMVVCLPRMSDAQTPPRRTDVAALRRTLDSLAARHRGVVGYSVRNLATGEAISRRGDETFPTASLIKVAILVTVYDLVAKGELALDDPLTVLRIDKVPGDGVLQHMHDGLTLTVGDAAWLMSTISDNTATNLLLDRIIIRRVWDKMESLGLRHTKVHSKTYRRNASVAMDSSMKYGFGVTTPDEIVALFALLAEGRAVNPASDSAMLHVLEQNTDIMLLMRYAGDVRASHKSGSTDEVRTDCALFHLRDRVVACVLTKQNADTTYAVDTEAHVAIARMGEAIVRAWKP
jgi:beta-lactamase class A